MYSNMRNLMTNPNLEYNIKKEYRTLEEKGTFCATQVLPGFAGHPKEIFSKESILVR